jgi:hypothetical protein
VAQLGEAVRLEPNDSHDGQPATFLPLGAEWAIRNPPTLAVTAPLPCDIAHTMMIEFEAASQTNAAGSIVLSGQGLKPSDSPKAVKYFPLGDIAPVPPGVFERPGPCRMRVRLEPSPALGWADPSVRSIWPSQIETNWTSVEIVRL